MENELFHLIKHTHLSHHKNTNVRKQLYEITLNIFLIRLSTLLTYHNINYTYQV